MEKKWSKWLLEMVAIVLMAMLAVGIISPAPAEAATRIDRIYRGQEKGWFLDSGDTLVVYYYPDGRSSTVAWKNNWYYWLRNSPFTTINIYSAPGSSGPWSWMYSDSVAPYYKSLPLWLRRGVYMFVIKNYTKGDIVSLKVY